MALIQDACLRGAKDGAADGREGTLEIEETLPASERRMSAVLRSRTSARDLNSPCLWSRADYIGDLLTIIAPVVRIAQMYLANCGEQIDEVLFV